MASATPCLRCRGTGTIESYACPGFRRVERTCGLCGGSGAITATQGHQIERAEAFHSARVERRESLRDAAARLGTTPALLSAMERGEMPMPLEWAA